jgi:hypothetical protein
MATPTKSRGEKFLEKNFRGVIAKLLLYLLQLIFMLLKIVV